MMKKPKDKRTKEYKEWKAKFDVEQAKKPDGLGDVVESITKATNNFSDTSLDKTTLLEISKNNVSTILSIGS